MTRQGFPAAPAKERTNVVKLHRALCNFIAALFTLLAAVPVQADIHPVLLKDDPELYAQVYFGMAYDEFIANLGSRLLECRPSTNKAVADIACKTGIKFGGLGLSEATSLFRNNELIAIIGKFNPQQHATIVSALTTSYKTPSQLVEHHERKTFFSKTSHNQFLIWSYLDYLMYITQPDPAEPANSGAYFLMAVESANPGFIEKLRTESRKQAGIEFQTRMATVDLEP